MTPIHIDFLVSYLNLTKVYLVPLWNMFSLPNKLISNQIPTIQSCEEVKISVGRVKISTNSFYFAHCTLVAPNCQVHLPICPRAKILFYGALKNSDDNRREALCSYLTVNLKSFRCYEAIFGHYLNYLLHYSQIVILERFYRHSSLESHRIDPLLLQGKVLISTKSFGKNYNHLIV